MILSTPKVHSIDIGFSERNHSAQWWTKISTYLEVSNAKILLEAIAHDDGTKNLLPTKEVSNKNLLLQAVCFPILM